MNRRVFLFLLGLFPLLLRSQTPQQFASLQEALRLAEATHPDIQRAMLNANIAQNQFVTTRSGLLPTLTASWNLDYNYQLATQLIPAQIFGGPEGTFRPVRFGTRFSTTVAADASVPIVSVGTWGGIQTAEIHNQTVAANLASERQNLQLRVAQLYYLILAGKEAIAINQANLAAADTLVAEARSRYSHGATDLSEVNRTLAVRVQAEQRLKSTELQLAVNINALRGLVGIKPDAEIAFLERIAPLGNPTTTQELPAERMPAYNALRLTLREREIALRTQRRRWIPEISAVGRFAYQGFANDFNSLVTKRQYWYPIGFVGLRTSVTLFGGLRQHRSVELARLQAEVARQELESYRLQAETENTELLLNYRQSLVTLPQAEELLRLAQENYRLGFLRYQGGLTSIDPVVNLNRELLDAQQQYYTQLAQARIYEASIYIKQNSAP